MMEANGSCAGEKRLVNDASSIPSIRPDPIKKFLWSGNFASQVCWNPCQSYWMRKSSRLWSRLGRYFATGWAPLHHVPIHILGRRHAPMSSRSDSYDVEKNAMTE